MLSKKNILVIFGGKSFEHKVSIDSTNSIISALDSKKYQIFPLAINKNGSWMSLEKSLTLLSPLARRKSAISKQGKEIIDIAFPVLHGPHGEDGTIQGFFEIIGLPYVGAGVLASALGIDKAMQKIIFATKGISVVKWISIDKHAWQKNKKEQIKLIERKFSYPLFIKPNNLGSSIGISKAHNKKELINGIELAFLYSEEVITEEAIETAREVECSVLGNDSPKASLPGEIISKREFYDYQAKYIEETSRLIIPAKLNKKLTSQIQAISLQAFKAIKCSGLARVDFLIKKQKIYLNEINTLPGFTKISMYPKLWQASGVGYRELLDCLIALGLDRNKKEQNRGGGKKIKASHLRLCDIRQWVV